MGSSDTRRGPEESEVPAWHLSGGVLRAARHTAQARGPDLGFGWEPSAHQGRGVRWPGESVSRPRGWPPSPHLRKTAPEVAHQLQSQGC